MTTPRAVPEELNVSRSDPTYMAHSYLTKVPVTAIQPFIAANTRVGDVVMDPFAGSGMTGIAAAMMGRRALLSDVSVLGQHIGRGYSTIAPADAIIDAARTVIAAASGEVGDLYAVGPRAVGGPRGVLAKTVWSVLVACRSCRQPVNFYRSLEAAGWRKASMTCPICNAAVDSKLPRVGEEPVIDFVTYPNSSHQVEQNHRRPVVPAPNPLNVGAPQVEITPDREMYQASALGKSGNTTIASFYSPRNLAVLASLHRQIGRVESTQVKQKLMFAFTACLARASKRYQWSRARPLNAVNANYYIAPIFYEWNVYELFQRKVDAAIRADRYLESTRYANGVAHAAVDVRYEIHSAHRLPYVDASIDYVFTDPPFGSNLFYADMALFQEAWLGALTDESTEAVIDRSSTGTRSATRYEELLTGALAECRRVLKTGGRISMVFGNSSGRVWAMVQRAITAARLRVVPEALVVLDKGQRSVKGLASGFEHTATLDLIITLEPTEMPVPPRRPSQEEVAAVIHAVSADPIGRTPSHLYLELLRTAFANNWSVVDFDLRAVVSDLTGSGYELDSKSGRIMATVSGKHIASSRRAPAAPAPTEVAALF